MRIPSSLLIFVLAASACAGGSAYVVEPDGGTGGSPDHPIAVDPPQMPPHVFNAAPVAVKNRPAYVAPPDLATLPKLVRSNQCTRPSNRGAYQSKPKPKPKPKPVKKTNKKPVRPYASGGSGSGAVLGGATKSESKSGANRPTDASTPTPAPRVYESSTQTAKNLGPPPGSAPMSGADYGDAAAPAGEAEMAATDDVSRGSERDRRNDRKARKETKKKDRSAAKRRPASPAADEAAGMAYEPMPVEDEDYIEPYPDPQPVAPIQQAEPEWPPEGQGWGDATYLSNDDTMSLSSAQRIIYAIDGFLPLPLEHIRPHELLNYFSFETAPVETGHDFSVKAEMSADPGEDGLHTLALSVQGRPVDYKNRRNATITLVVDRSGSMKEEGRMDYLKRGLQRMVSELKTGDIVNLVTFDDRVCTPLQNFVVGRDDPQILRKAITAIRPRGATDIHGALTRGYELADQAYMGSYSNRVLLVTDALANTGITDANTMSLIADWYDSRRIRLSGIGVGREFNDRLLDRMTERGRGAYVFLGSEAEVDAVFGPNFVSLIETTANDVHFRLHLPPALRMQRFHGEEASTHKEDVQAIHYFANTSQLFLADLEPWQGQLRTQDWLMLEIEYGDPESGQELVEEYAFRVGDIASNGNNVRKAKLISFWADALSAMASRPPPGGWGARQHGWIDPYGAQTCQDVRGRLNEMSQGLSDPEVQRVIGLWDRYCLRYGATDRPPRKDAGQTGWPGARG